MRRGFTLIELLIVVVVLVTLMSIAFRLGSVGTDQSYRATTISRLHKLENCLSGYYAAFGTYPAVRLHGSRDYTTKICKHGIQSMSDSDSGSQLDFSWLAGGVVANEKNEAEDWRRVKAACLAQPVRCSYPHTEGMADYLMAISAQLGDAEDDCLEKKEVFASGFDDGVSQNIGRHSQGKNYYEWQQVQLFKFGLMSFLLPRYLIMMGANEKLHFQYYAQWTANNTLPCNALTGEKFSDWDQLGGYAVKPKEKDRVCVANIPSQSVTARWIANLEGICVSSVPIKLYGIYVTPDDDGGMPENTDNIEAYAPSSGESGHYDSCGTSSQYALDAITVLDAWDNDFYYYSPAPYQSYVLWSSGKNERTFPPWVPREKLSKKALECVEYWTADDIVGMSN